MDGLNYAESLSFCIKEHTPQGLIHALSTVSSANVTNCCTEDHCQALQNLILDYILAKVESLSSDEISMLNNLPVWRVHSSGPKIFTSLGEDLFMPPISIPEELLSEKFIAYRSSDDERCYRVLKLPTLSSSDFYLQYILPLSENDEFSVEETKIIASDVLKNCS